MRLDGLACSMILPLLGAAALLGGCSDDGLAPDAVETNAAGSSGGTGATSSVNTSATVTATEGDDKYDVPPADPSGDTTGGFDESGDTGPSGTGTAGDSEGDSGTTGEPPPEPPCVAAEECHCDPGPVICESLPPRCPPDFVPLVDEATQCWEGSCVPLEACYTVTECAWCDDDEACVAALDLGGAHYTCQPVDPMCPDMQPTCECMPMACDAPFFMCVPTEPGGGDQDLTCVCPTC